MDAAEATLTQVVQQYPGTDAARLAQDRLRAIQLARSASEPSRRACKLAAMSARPARHRRGRRRTAERLKLTEIFLSLQGEADAIGWPTVFVRLTGCPLRCVLCDTAYAFHGGEWRDDRRRSSPKSPATACATSA